jgi:urease accessory protein UreE
VIEEMLYGFGVDLVKVVQAPFQPEGGAYSGHVDHHNHDHAGSRHE